MEDKGTFEQAFVLVPNVGGCCNDVLMTSPTDLLAQQSAVLAEKVTGLFGSSPESPLAAVLTGASDSALLDILGAIGQNARLLDAVGARIAGELTRRSARTESEPLAKRLGEKSAIHLISARTGLGTSRSVDWSRTGSRLAPRVTLIGEPLPAEYPLVSAALDEGDLSLDQARGILDALSAIKPHVDLDKLAWLQEFLVGQAALLPASDLMRLCRVLPDRYNPDGVEPREEELRTLAGVKLIQRRNGMLRLIADLDPESGGYVKTALDARTAPRRQVGFLDADDPQLDAVLDDPRTVPQRRVDALVGMAKDDLKADRGDLSGVSATVLVIVDQEALEIGIGSATIAGVDTPVSAATARRMACDARIIPVVLGGASQPLDLGASRRLFSEAQRLAMAVRDGGCIWPGCGEPSGRCEAAHLKPWRDGGRTSVDNGVLMCPFHHRRFDNDGWELEYRDGERYLIPPAWADAARRPRLIARPPRVA